MNSNLKAMQTKQATMAQVHEERTLATRMREAIGFCK